MESDKESDKETCQRFYATLLHCLTRETMVTAPMYIRLWNHTKQCDHVADMSDVREHIKNTLGLATRVRIQEFRETLVDEAHALQHMMREGEGQAKRLRQTLTWPQYLSHQLDRITATLSREPVGLRAATRHYLERRRFVDKVTSN